jgi:hypothetical protein
MATRKVTVTLGVDEVDEQRAVRIGDLRRLDESVRLIEV